MTSLRAKLGVAHSLQGFEAESAILYEREHVIVRVTLKEMLVYEGNQKKALDKHLGV